MSQSLYIKLKYVLQVIARNKKIIGVIPTTAIPKDLKQQLLYEAINGNFSTKIRKNKIAFNQFSSLLDEDLCLKNMKLCNECGTDLTENICFCGKGYKHDVEISWKESL